MPRGKNIFHVTAVAAPEKNPWARQWKALQGTLAKHYMQELAHGNVHLSSLLIFAITVYAQAEGCICWLVWYNVTMHVCIELSMEMLECKPCKYKLEGTIRTGQSSKTAESSSFLQGCFCKIDLYLQGLALIPGSSLLLLKSSQTTSLCGTSSWQYFWPHLLQPSTHPGYEFHFFLEPRLWCKINRWALCTEMCTDRGAKQQGKGCPLSHSTVTCFWEA